MLVDLDESIEMTVAVVVVAAYVADTKMPSAGTSDALAPLEVLLLVLVPMVMEKLLEGRSVVEPYLVDIMVLGCH